MPHLCVFLGSSSGGRPEYLLAARSLALALAGRGWTLVYGGAKVGLMGTLADATLDAGGEVLGVMPRFLVEREVAHQELSRLEIVETMQERKARLLELADAVLALPGGLGTLEEVTEVLTRFQLGFHRKPLGLLNICGYYDQLLAWLDHGVTEGFLRREHLAGLVVESEPEAMLDALATHLPR